MGMGGPASRVRAAGPGKDRFFEHFFVAKFRRCCAARSAASGKRKRPPAQRKIFGFHNPHYRFPDTELSGIRARAPRQNTDFARGISDFWRSEAVSAPQAKILRFRRPKVTILSRFQRSLESHPASGPEDPIFLPIFLSEKSQIIV